MKRVALNFLVNLLAVASASGLFLAYVKTFCAYSMTSQTAGLVCRLNWKDGAILLGSYSAVKVGSSIFNSNTIYKILLAALILYSIVYVMIAPPYWFSSFFQELEANSLYHTLLIITVVELLQFQLRKMSPGLG